MAITPSSLDFPPQTVATAGSLAVAARYYASLTVITDAACTATIIRVDVDPASLPPGTLPPIPGSPVVTAANQTTVASSTLFTMPVDWPFYIVQAAGGTCRVGLV